MNDTLENKTIANVSQQVEAFVAECIKRGVTIERVTGSVITLYKGFAPGDKSAYCKAEGDVGIIYTVRQTEPGSTWGTDGASIGGYVGLRGGYMRLHRSGCSKRWLKELQRHVGREVAQ